MVNYSELQDFTAISKMEESKTLIENVQIASKQMKRLSTSYVIRET